MSKFRTPNPGRFKRPAENKKLSAGFIALILVLWLVGLFVGVAIGEILSQLSKYLGFVAV